jgi:hypothetical protein
MMILPFQPVAPLNRLGGLDFLTTAANKEMDFLFMSADYLLREK